MNLPLRDELFLLHVFIDFILFEETRYEYKIGVNFILNKTGII